MKPGSWRKLGLIYCPDGKIPWMQTHAAVPIAEPIGDDMYRIYFSTRDSQNRSHTASLVLDINHPQAIREVNSIPVISPGDLGCFDDSGAMACWLTRQGNERYLYYVGWNLGVSVPFRNAIGLAVSRNHEPFVRVAPGPIVDRTMFEPHFCASCCVLPDGNTWRMWYLSCTEWSISDGMPEHRYHIKYAESPDGIHWQRDGIVSIDYSGAKENAISRPSVIRDSDSWHMWFSVRGPAYRIGYATSLDGIEWQRQDTDAGLDVAQSGWDSNMVEYPHVFEHRGQHFMLYNGNGFGQSGFGLAVWE